MSNKFPGFVQITPEHARAIQFDVQLYIYWPNKEYHSPQASAFTPDERRSANENDGNWDSSYWAEEDEEDRRRAWYIKVDDDKLEYTPTNFEEPQR